MSNLMGMFNNSLENLQNLENIDLINNSSNLFYQKGLQFLLVFILLILAHFIIKIITPFFLRLSLLPFGLKKDQEQIQKRIKTLTVLINTTSFVIISIYFIFYVFQVLSINIQPFLIGAGILTFPIAFGAQSLIKDIIAGIFIILENQYNLGDMIKLDDYEGKVIDINFRRTILENDQGGRHIIPNGKINIVTNNTTNFKIIDLKIPINLDADLNTINQVIESKIKEVTEQVKDQGLILEGPLNKGINEIKGKTAEIIIWLKVKPQVKLKLKRDLLNQIIKELNFKKLL